MNFIYVEHTRNIEKALHDYLNKGYSCLYFEKSAEVEVRFYLQRDQESEIICIARQFWDELCPESIGECDELPNPHIEWKTRSHEEFTSMYHLLKSNGIVKAIPNDDLSDVPVIPLNCEMRTLLVCPDGYTWE